MKSDVRFLRVLLAIFMLVLAWSAIEPHDYFTWLLEVAPAIVGLVVLVATRRSFRFSRLAYGLMLLHAVVLMIGGHYTYAEVPAFNWLRDALDLSRNYYDRVGHLAQGFVPAVVAREILLRLNVLRRGAWLNALIVCVCLAISAFYELIEWWVAVATGTAAEAFLGTQGDVWDTQWDMFLALIGAILALSTLSRVHDHSMAVARRA